VTPPRVDRFQALMEKSFNAAYTTGGAATPSRMLPEELNEAENLLTAIDAELRGAR
jgi:hypothetical protein